MYRTKLPVNLIVSEKTNKEIKKVIREKSSGKTQKDIYKENNIRLKVLREPLD